MEIKICGITRSVDALHAASLGVQWLGFNFVPSSKRFISPEKAAQIIASLPSDVHKVGVFMNQSPAEIRAVLDVVPLDVLQFHGEEPVAELAEFNQIRIKVFAVDSRFNPREPEKYDSVCEFFLFDAKVGTQTGGTGSVFDWKQIPACSKPFFLAGGVGPANLREALQKVPAFGVDLNSKLESAPGVKCPVLVEQCVKLVQEVRSKNP